LIVHAADNAAVRIFVSLPSIMAAQTINYLDPLVVGKLKNIEIKARLIVEGFITGLHRSPYHGFSVEFAEHRPYNTGESLKNIDWKVYGKTDKLFVKRYEEETNLRCHVVLDVSDSMRYPVGGPMNKLEYGAYLSAALCYLMVKQRDAAGMALFDQTLNYYVPPKAKMSWLVRIFQKLEEVVAQKEYFAHRTATPVVLHQIAKKISRRGMVVVISDLFSPAHPLEELFPALQHLRHANHEVLVFQLLERDTEAEFNFPNTPLILKDLETGEELKVQPEQIKSEYRKYLAEHNDRLRRKCRELNIDLVEVDIRKP
jgi:uncharacterized protein (DUF58 family)